MLLICLLRYLFLVHGGRFTHLFLVGARIIEEISVSFCFLWFIAFCSFLYASACVYVWACVFGLRVRKKKRHHMEK